MPQEQVQGETPEQQETPVGEMPQAQQQEQEQPEQAGMTEREKELLAERERLAKALKAANQEAAERRKKLDAYEQEEQKKREAEMTELEKLQAKLKEATEANKAAQAELAQRRVEDQKREMARRMGLPEVLALRIQGETAEEMEADAKALLEGLPKTRLPSVQPTNPGEGSGPRQTDSQLREMIYGTADRNSIFTPGAAAKHGGGVVWKEKPN